jgi:hypothetical protein
MPVLQGSGLIGSTSGRPDGVFANAIMANSIIDLRNSAHEKPKAELLEDIKRSLISGEKRSDFDGDGVWETTALPVAPYQRWIEDGVVASYLQQSTHKQSGTKLHCDIIGSIDNYPQAWKDALANGYTLMGTPLLVGENGEDYIPDGTTSNTKLSHKMVNYNLFVGTPDNGVSWTVHGNTVNTTGNYLPQASTFATGYITLLFYTTTDNPTYPAVNSECLEIGDVAALSNNQVDKGNALLTALINKVGVSTDDYEQLLAENTSVMLFMHTSKKLSLTQV